LDNFDMARESFLKHAGKHWYRLRLQATDTLTLEPIRCDCQVVGVWRDGLIVLKDGELHAEGENPERHNLYPTHAELVEGEPLRVVAHRVDLRGRTLGWLLDRLDRSHTHYLSGELRLGGRATAPLEDLERYRPATLSGQRLLLHYARAEDLTPYLGLVAAEGEVFVQFWLKPGDAAVELAILDPTDRDTIPEELRGYP
jgi:inner membrane protein